MCLPSADVDAAVASAAVFPSFRSSWLELFHSLPRQAFSSHLLQWSLCGWSSQPSTEPDFCCRQSQWGWSSSASAEVKVGPVCILIFLPLADGSTSPVVEGESLFVVLGRSSFSALIKKTWRAETLLKQGCSGSRSAESACFHRGQVAEADGRWCFARFCEENWGHWLSACTAWTIKVQELRALKATMNKHMLVQLRSTNLQTQSQCWMRGPLPQLPTLKGCTIVLQLWLRCVASSSYDGKIEMFNHFSICQWLASQCMIVFNWSVKHF